MDENSVNILEWFGFFHLPTFQLNQWAKPNFCEFDLRIGKKLSYLKDGVIHESVSIKQIFEITLRSLEKYRFV